MVRPLDLQRLPERLREKQRLASSRLLGRQLAGGHALGRLDGMGWKAFLGLGIL